MKIRSFIFSNRNWKVYYKNALNALVLQLVILFHFISLLFIYIVLLSSAEPSGIELWIILAIVSSILICLCCPLFIFLAIRDPYKGPFAQAKVCALFVSSLLQLINEILQLLPENFIFNFISHN